MSFQNRNVFHMQALHQLFPYGSPPWPTSCCSMPKIWEWLFYSPWLSPPFLHLPMAQPSFPSHPVAQPSFASPPNFPSPLSPYHPPSPFTPSPGHPLTPFPNHLPHSSSPLRFSPNQLLHAAAACLPLNGTP